MKEKLCEAMRNVGMANNRLFDYAKECADEKEARPFIYAREPLKEALALIDTILATLDSEESSLKMTMKTLQEIQDVHDEFGFGCFRARKVLKKITDKKAAIDAIKS